MHHRQPTECVRVSVAVPCRYKGLCEGSARAAGISTARLPIAKHIQLASRAVLTVNHVFQVRGCAAWCLERGMGRAHGQRPGKWCACLRRTAACRTLRL